jgi:nitrite reductase (NADH) large subunit
VEDVDSETLLRTIDRFLMYYIRTADRLQRTATWLEQLEGGLDHVRAVVLDDSLGIAADLDAAMAVHVATYRDEWRDVLDDPVKLARFAGFVNDAEAVDDNLRYVSERGQHRPATPYERDAGVGLVDSEGRRPVMIGGPSIPVRVDGDASAPEQSGQGASAPELVHRGGPR